MYTIRRLSLLAIVPFALACGDDGGTTDGGSDTSVTLDSGADTGGDTSVGDTSVGDTGADVGGDTSVAGPCPSTVPTDGATCDREGLECGYGDDPRFACEDIAVCSGGTFTVTVNDCDPIPPTTCPATREDAAGMACDDDGSICVYESLNCYCTNCPRGSPVCMGGPTMWSCDAPNADAECPPALPHRGTACGMEGKTCTYGCEEDTQRVCTDGAWIAATPPGGCPASTRRAKRDIHYLGAAEVQALAEAVDDTRLTTYEYVDPALRGRTRLGFIIEDQPASYAVDPERSQVDLYGYTSMLVAAVQSQNRRIEELEQQLAALQECR